MAADVGSKTAKPGQDKPAHANEEEVQGLEKFSPEEEADLVRESNTHKSEANSLFSAAQYQDAIDKYGEAITACPNYLDYELAVLESNLAACQLKLQEWKAAIKSATAALDRLDRIERTEEEAAAKAEQERKKAREEEEADLEGEIISEGAAKAAPAPPKEEEDDLEGEIISEGAAKAAPAPPKEEEDDDRAEAARRRQRLEDVRRIRAKALMRRARARSEAGGWSNLAGAEEDYKALSGMPNLGAQDRKTVLAQLRALPPRTKEAQERETAEMWGKLKDLGNGILKPFGLSTNNFQMVKDEKTGGYSMNFKQ